MTMAVYWGGGGGGGGKAINQQKKQQHFFAIKHQSTSWGFRLYMSPVFPRN